MVTLVTPEPSGGGGPAGNTSVSHIRSDATTITLSIRENTCPPVLVEPLDANRKRNTPTLSPITLASWPFVPFWPTTEGSFW